MKDAFASEFEKTLERMQWPSKNVRMTVEVEKAWTAGVGELLDLQEPYVLIEIFLYVLIAAQRFSLLAICFPKIEMAAASSMVYSGEVLFSSIPWS